MAKQFFKDLPDTSTPLRASRLNGLFDGEEALGNIVVDSIKTTNLLNPNTLINGSVSASDGSYSNLNYVVVSDYIPVEANKSYTIKLNNVTNNQFLFRIVLYTTGKAYSSTLHTGSEVTQKTITPSIDGYVRICFGMNGYAVLSPTTIAEANPQFEQSSSATAYKPYIEFGVDNFKNEEIVVGSIRSKNIYNPSAMPLLNGLWQSNGKIVTNAAGNYVVVPIKGGTTYSISRKYDNTTSGIQFLIATTANYPVNNETLLSYQNSSTDTQYTLTTPSTANYLWLGLLGSGSPSEQQKAQAIDELQVEEGSTATNYMPYQNLNGMETYSTDETVIGTFLGKPLYRKVIEATPNITQSSTTGSFDINIANVEQVFITDKTKIADTNNSGFVYSFPFIGSNMSIGGYIGVQTSKLIFNIRKTNNVGCYALRVVLEYTKTTD